MTDNTRRVALINAFDKLPTQTQDAVLDTFERKCAAYVMVKSAYMQMAQSGYKRHRLMCGKKR